MAQDDCNASPEPHQRLEFSGRLTFEDQHLFENRRLGIAGQVFGACLVGYTIWDQRSSARMSGAGAATMQLVYILGIGCLVLHYIRKFLTKLRMQKASEAREGVYQPCNYTVTKQGLTMKTKDTETKISWSALESWKSTAE